MVSVIQHSFGRSEFRFLLPQISPDWRKPRNLEPLTSPISPMRGADFIRDSSFRKIRADRFFCAIHGPRDLLYPANRWQILANDG
jgi:hypothetical protein